MLSQFSLSLLRAFCLTAWCTATHQVFAQTSADGPAESAAEAAVEFADEGIGEDASKEAASIRKELQMLREGLVEALIAGDIEKQLTYAHEDIVTTWQNNRTTRGIKELKAFFEEMNRQGPKVFQGYKQQPTIDAPSIIYDGDTAVAAGVSVPSYKLLGMEFDLQNRWTATLVKQDGQWLIANYHVSANLLDNPILTAAKRFVYVIGGVGLLVGLALGGGVALLFFKRKGA